MTTDPEKTVLDHLAAAWNEFALLPSQHPADRDDFMRSIHAAQNIIGCRVAQRADPATWPLRSEERS